MWTTLVFMLVFVGLGLGVLFVAMSGGPGGARARLRVAEPRHAGGSRWSTSCSRCCSSGSAIPAAVIATVNSRNDIPEPPTSANLTKAEEHGRELFAVHCATATR